MKKLNILLGNNTLSLLAGSETWTLTLALELKKLGHDVSCFSPELGIISNKLIDAGIPCFDEISTIGVSPFSIVLEEHLKHEYDVIIANHNHIVDYLRSKFPITPIISTIHGILHCSEDGKEIYPEHPAMNAGVNQFVSVSEEVQKKLKDDYQIESSIIRNFFDIKKFGSLKPITEKKPKQFLINTNYMDRNDPVVQSIKEAAKFFGAKVGAIGMNFSPSSDMAKAIEDSDVVFGMGRSVLEGVAAGRLGIVYGRWGMGGPITKDNLEMLRYFKFSGRNARTTNAVTPEEIIKMIEQYYHPEYLEWGKQYMAREHNAVFGAEEYVRLARELTGELVVRPIINQGSNSGVAPDTRPFKLAKDA